MSTIRMNNRMRSLYGKVIPPCSMERDSLDVVLNDVLDKGIRLVDGCLLLEANLQVEGPSFKSAKHSGFFDRADAEHSINEVGINFIMSNENASNEEVLQQGVIFAHCLEEMFSTYIRVPVRIIISFNQEGYRNCTVRFFIVRDDEPPMVSGDLEEYSREAIMTITTGIDGDDA